MPNEEEFRTGTTLPEWASDAEATLESPSWAGCCPEWDEQFAALMGPNDVTPEFSAHFETCRRCQDAYGIRVEGVRAGPDDAFDEAPTGTYARQFPDVPVPRLTTPGWKIALIVALILAIGVSVGVFAVGIEAFVI